MKVATWNVNCWNPGRGPDKLRLLQLESWDIALLQEVGPETFDTFTAGGELAGVSGVDLAGGPWGAKSHGAAILVRDPNVIRSSGVLPMDGVSDSRGESLLARGVWSTIETPSGEVTVASLHTLNAAGKGEERESKIAEKMAHYRAIHCWASAVPRPLVIGMDGNGWEDWSVERRIDPSDAFADQVRFLGVGASHGLRDVLVDHLVSNRTIYTDALTVGSDHALVIANLSYATC